jgi:quercetin dioxygenase-like cupin family protein
MSAVSAQSLFTHPLHLGLGATAVPQEAFTGMAWYADYTARHAADGKEGRLVSLYTFTEAWDAWEMHPAGDEAVVCVAGAITLLQEDPAGAISTIHLAPGEYAINPPGTWHTADVSESATVLFITAGEGTQHRPRGGGLSSE